MSIIRKPDETEFEFHKRLVYGKLVDKTLADVDYSELSDQIYGEHYASDETRKRMYGSRYTLELLERENIKNIEKNDVISDIDAKMAELKRERQKFFDERAAYNKLLRERSRQEELNEILSKQISEGKLPSLLPTSNINVDKSDNDLIVSLNDIHYGANFKNAWMEYNSDICKTMMEEYIKEILKIKYMHDSENCIVVCAGDNISGNIHKSIAITNKENVIEQITGVSELISEFVAELSKHFKTVKFISVPGNHSRITINKDEDFMRERLDDLTEWYLKARLQNFDNVIINDEHKLDSTISVFDVRGKKYCCVHGDFDGTSAKVQSLQSMIPERLYCVLSGHMHHNAANEVQGIKTLMAGSFLGCDDYCVQKRIVGKPQQMVCVCDSNGVVCHYDINL